MNVERIVVFEDAECERLQPLVHLQPVWELRCGMMTLLERIRRAHSDKSVILRCRELLADTAAEDNPDETVNKEAEGDFLLLNGRLCSCGEFAGMTSGDDECVVCSDDGQILAALLKNIRLQDYFNDEGLLDIERLRRPNPPERRLGDVRIISHLWDLIKHNEAMLREDWRTLYAALPQHRGDVATGAVLD